jgi:acyl carrier protein
MNPRKKLELELLFIISEMHNRPVSSMDENTNLYNNLTFDSLDLVELAIEVERKWNFNMVEVCPPKKIKQVKDILNLIEKYENSQTSPSKEVTQKSLPQQVVAGN